MSDEFLIPPPSNMTVTHERKAVLYLPDGRVLVRQAGFQGVRTMAGYGHGKDTGKTPEGGGPKKA